MHLIYITLSLLSWVIKDVVGGKLSPTDTLTWGEDNSRSGYSPNHNMDPSVVGSAQFGQLWTSMLPGNYRGNVEQIYSQPLVYTLDDGIQYVFIATTQNNVYKINAKTGNIVASRNLHIPFLSSDIVPCTDISPLVGVTGTGVIDSTTDTWYLTAKTYNDQTDQVKGLDNGRYFFHAIDVNTLAEKPSFPQPLEGIIARNNANRMFMGGRHHQRPALLLTGQYVYAGFASHCVQYNFTGWVMGWDKTSGSLVEHFSTEAGPEPNTTPGGGVWMSGGGIATDNKGSMYFSTGNGYSSQLHGVPVPGRQPPTALEEAAVNMKINDDGSLSVVDFFMPWEKEQLDGADKDLGTTPLELLPPDTFNCPNVKRMGVVTGKSGKTYILNLDNLGGYQMGVNKLDAIPQAPIQNENSVYAGAGVYPLEGGYIYINVIQYQTHVFKFSCDASGNPAFTKVADSPEKAAYVLGVGHGAATSLNGQAGTGLYWMTDVDGYNLRIYNAVPQSGSLQLIKTANIPGVTKFARPVFGDGRAYVGTTQGLLYAFGSPVNLPLTCTSPNDFGKISINGTSAVKTIQCQANTYTQVKAITLKNTANFQISGLPSLPVDVPAGTNISFNAVFKPAAPGPLSVDVAISTSSGDSKYSSITPVSLKGVGTSAKPLLAVNPNTVSFTGVIVNQTESGATESVIFSNVGDSVLTVQGLDYSVVSETGAYVTPNKTANGVQVGPFTFSNIPTTIANNTDAIVKINFNPTSTGNFAVYVHVRTDGGTKILDVFGTASSYPTALLEFEAADGSGKWIPYTHNDPPFTFGNVYEAQTKSLRMRLTNNGSSSAGSLSVTVSKPPFGVPGIVGAQNGADLGEGTNLAAGQSATAVLFCSVPKSQVNVDSYNGSATWVMNTGDPNFGKQNIQFACNAVAEQVGPLAANRSATYRYGGCYKENNPGRQLKTQLYGNDASMTNDKCINGCAAAGYAIAASEYVNECWCGNRFPSTLGNETDCNYVCANNASQTCGGNGYFHDHAFMSLFTNGKALPALPNIPAAVLPSYGAYNYNGCYTEGRGGRALADKNTASDEMTVATCATFCSGSQYFGIEYASECYCGSTIGNGAAVTSQGDCSMTCSGDYTEYCGAGNRLTVYGLNGTAPASPSGTSTSASGTSTSASSASTSTASTSVTGAPTAVPSAAGFAYQGCYTEGTSGRALGDSQTAYDGMTVEKCAAYCSGYSYFGVEYMSECYCGNSIGVGAVPATDNGCTMACSGNAGELCGGPNRLNFYTKGNSSTTSSTATSTTTTGTSPTGTGTSTSTSATSSTATSTTTTGTSPTGTGTSTSTSATSTSTGPAVVQTASSFAFQGCYSEGTNGRALAATSTVSGAMTVEICAAFCKGYTYMGVEYSSECYCDNTIGPGGVPVTDGGCSMTCAGAPSEFCGGPNRLNFYKSSPSASGSSTTTSQTSISASLASTSTSLTSTVTSSTSSSASATATGPITVQSVPGYGYLGCYSEVAYGRALTDLQNPISSDKVSVEACGIACAGYNYFAVEYASECYCGNTIQAGSAPVSERILRWTQPSQHVPEGLEQLDINYLFKYDVKAIIKHHEQYDYDVQATHQFNDFKQLRLFDNHKQHVHGIIDELIDHHKQHVHGIIDEFIDHHFNDLKQLKLVADNEQHVQHIINEFIDELIDHHFNDLKQLKLVADNEQDVHHIIDVINVHLQTILNHQLDYQLDFKLKNKYLNHIQPDISGNVNFTYTACWAEPTSGRALQTLVKANDSMTVEMCLSACYNYQYAGIEYGRECWCDNSIASTSAQAPDQSQCNKKCPGDSTEICGAGLRLSLYTHKSSALQANVAQVKANSATTTTSGTSTTSQTSSSSTSTTKSSSASATTFLTQTSSTSSSSTTTTSQSSTTSKTSTISSSSTLYPTPSQIVSSYSYLGCANATTPLALNALTKTSSTMDIQTCQSYCTQNNYGLSGLQNGDTCYCGNGLQSFSAIQTESGAAKDSKCSVPCAGNSTEICGAAAYLSVWNATEAVKVPATMVKQVGYYPLKGCYNSTVSASSSLLNAASTSLPSTNSAESCVGYCSTRGYSVAGMENGNGCKCGASLPTTAAQLDLSQCNVVCSGNTREFCGANGKTLVYVMDTSSVDGNGNPKSLGQTNDATIQPAA
ncbi:MAG: hypothetical protein LQ338_006265 [Usnochroma carphineum]|nr:MAG: hypothetical protein LQ338_006265 [Usnochroma carphineum]